MARENSPINKINYPLRGILLAGLIALIGAIAIGESMRRFLDGYEILTPRLIVKSGGTLEQTRYGRDAFQKLVKELTGDSGVAAELFDQVPAAQIKTEIPEILRSRSVASPKMGYHTNFVFNRNFVRQHVNNEMFFGGDFPDRVFTYRPDYPETLPRYRYYPNARLTFGFQTNSYGWRGPDIPVDKQPRTIRIAALGDSTTTHQVGILISYPEYIVHWLEILARQKGYDVRFEAINSGRESIDSLNVAAILRYEVQPMEPDYVLFYGLGNQWDLSALVTIEEPRGIGPQAANKYYGESAIAELVSKSVTSIAPWSATASWVQRRWLRSTSCIGAEPRKPKQSFLLPVGLSEMTPDISNLKGVPQFKGYITDFNDMLNLTRSSGARFVLQNFKFLTHDGLTLDLARDASIYSYLNNTNSQKV